MALWNEKCLKSLDVRPDVRLLLIPHNCELLRNDRVIRSLKKMRPFLLQPVCLCACDLGKGGSELAHTTPTRLFHDTRAAQLALSLLARSEFLQKSRKSVNCVVEVREYESFFAEVSCATAAIRSLLACVFGSVQF